MAMGTRKADEIIVRLMEMKNEPAFEKARKLHRSKELYTHAGFRHTLDWVLDLKQVQRNEYTRQRRLLRDALDGALLKADPTEQVDWVSTVVLEDIRRVGFEVEVTFDGTTWEPITGGQHYDIGAEYTGGDACVDMRIIVKQ